MLIDRGKILKIYVKLSEFIIFLCLGRRMLHVQLYAKSYKCQGLQGIDTGLYGGYYMGLQPCVHLQGHEVIYAPAL